MARVMTVPIDKVQVRCSWIFSLSLGKHGLDSKWSFRQETGVTEVYVSLLGLSNLNLFHGNVSPTVQEFHF
jgi:hypothetical protein